MHLPRLRPRLRLRTLLIAVAVLGLALGGWTMWERRRLFLERGKHHAVVLDGIDIDFKILRIQVDGLPDSEAARLLTRYRDRWLPQTEYHRRLRSKYEHAARYPWLPVEPDPPRPE